MVISPTGQCWGELILLRMCPCTVPVVKHALPVDSNRDIMPDVKLPIDEGHHNLAETSDMKHSTFWLPYGFASL